MDDSKITGSRETVPSGWKLKKQEKAKGKAGREERKQVSRPVLKRQVKLDGSVIVEKLERQMEEKSR